MKNIVKLFRVAANEALRTHVGTSLIQGVTTGALSAEASVRTGNRHSLVAGVIVGAGISIGRMIAESVGIYKKLKRTADPKTLKSLFIEADREVLYPSIKSNIRKILEYLSGSHTITQLAEDGSASKVMSVIEALPQNAQKKIFTSHLAIASLAEKGCAERVIKLIEAMPEKAQQEILAKQYAVVSLMENGQATKTVALVERMPKTAQEHIFSSEYSLYNIGWSLAGMKQSCLVRKIENSWDNDPIRSFAELTSRAASLVA